MELAYSTDFFRYLDSTFLLLFPFTLGIFCRHGGKAFVLISLPEESGRLIAHHFTFDFGTRYVAGQGFCARGKVKGGEGRCMERDGLDVSCCIYMCVHGSRGPQPISFVFFFCHFPLAILQKIRGWEGGPMPGWEEGSFGGCLYDGGAKRTRKLISATSKKKKPPLFFFAKNHPSIQCTLFPISLFGGWGHCPWPLPPPFPPNYDMVLFYPLIRSVLRIPTSQVIVGDRDAYHR